MTGRHRKPAPPVSPVPALVLGGVFAVLACAAPAATATTGFTPGAVKAAVLEQPAPQPAPRIPPIIGANGLTPRTAALAHWVQATFPGVPEIGGWRPPDGYHEHDRGIALDIMVDPVLGDEIADAVLSQPGVRFVIWKQQIRYPDGTRRWMTDRGNPNANHYTHVHVAVAS